MTHRQNQLFMDDLYGLFCLCFKLCLSSYHCYCLCRRPCLRSSTRCSTVPGSVNNPYSPGVPCASCYVYLHPEEAEVAHHATAQPESGAACLTIKTRFQGIILQLASPTPVVALYALSCLQQVARDLA